MAEWRPFAATNEPDTCLWCGRKLRHRAVTDWPPGQPNGVKIGVEPLGGDYSDGHFCGLRCGYQFGVSIANGGRRSVPRTAVS